MKTPPISRHLPPYPAQISPNTDRIPPATNLASEAPYSGSTSASMRSAREMEPMRSPVSGSNHRDCGMPRLSFRYLQEEKYNGAKYGSQWGSSHDRQVFRVHNGEVQRLMPCQPRHPEYIAHLPASKSGARARRTFRLHAGDAGSGFGGQGCSRLKKWLGMPWI